MLDRFFINKTGGEGFFSEFYCENLEELHEVKLTKVCPPPPLLILGLIYTQPSAIHQLQVEISYSGTVSRGGFCLIDFCSSKLWFCVSAGLSHSGGSDFPCGLTFLMDLRKIIDLFSLLGFLFAVRLEWWLPSSSYSRQDTRSLKSVLICWILWEIYVFPLSSN